MFNSNFLIVLGVISFFLMTSIITNYRLVQTNAELKLKLESANAATATANENLWRNYETSYDFQLRSLGIDDSFFQFDSMLFNAAACVPGNETSSGSDDTSETVGLSKERAARYRSLNKTGYDCERDAEKLERLQNWINQTSDQGRK